MSPEQAYWLQKRLLSKEKDSNTILPLWRRGKTLTDGAEPN